MKTIATKQTKPLRAVLIGLGQIGASYGEDPKTRRYFEFATHAEVLEQHPDFDWVGACDRSLKACDSARRRWPELTVVSDVARLNGLEPDVAVLATGPQARLEIVEHLPSLQGLVTEKPIGTCSQNARAFAAACEDRSLLAQVNLWRRAERAMRTLASGGLSQMIGTAQAGFVLYGRGIRNNGTHLVDACRMLLGEPTSVQATSQPRRIESPGVKEDFDIAFSMQFPSELTVAFQPLKFRHFRENAIEIWGTKGCYTIHQEGLVHRVFPRTDHRAMEDAAEIDRDAPCRIANFVGRSLYDLYSNLAEALSGVCSLWSPVASAVRTQDVVEAVIESARRNGTRMELEPCHTIPRRRAS